jgi:hypothetical protein
MAQVDGFKQTFDALGKLVSRASKDQATFRVGYSAEYATYVHENLEAHHPNGGQAKFLEQPAREMERDLQRIIEEAMYASSLFYLQTGGHGKTLTQALEQAGNALLTESKKLVPVDTGKLRDSGFVKVE